VTAGRPLRTSREVFHRIRWDPGLDPARFTVGYADRRGGRRELPLLELQPDGPIRWSRVWTFAREGEVVWDRAARLDRVFGSGDTPPGVRLGRRVAGARRGGRGLGPRRRAAPGASTRPRGPGSR